MWHGLVTDVSEREQLQNELREQAETDPLTHLANRPALMTLMRQRLQTGQSFAVLFMDCDRFKQVNDSHGHVVGDEVLDTSVKARLERMKVALTACMRKFLTILNAMMRDQVPFRQTVLV